MTKFDEFYLFVKSVDPNICDLWEDFHNRPDPKPGDRYMYLDNNAGINQTQCFNVVFDKVWFDNEFTNGVAFYYIFHKEDTGEEIKVHTINDIYDYDKLTFNERNDVYSFWQRCIPIINNEDDE